MRRCCPIKGVPSAVTSEPSAFILKHKRNYVQALVPETFTLTREYERGVTEPYGLVRMGRGVLDGRRVRWKRKWGQCVRELGSCMGATLTAAVGKQRLRMWWTCV